MPMGRSIITTAQTLKELTMHYLRYVKVVIMPVNQKAILAQI